MSSENKPVNQLTATKSLEALKKEAEHGGGLKRALGPVGLTSLGVGAIIGAGIFVMTGETAANDAGPAVLISYLVAGLACATAALCYAEFAAMAPVSGSAYTYAYATMGELAAWIIGWDLILEYAMSSATVSAAWSKYLNELLRVIGGEGLTVPAYLCHDPFSTPGAWFNLPAVLIMLGLTAIIATGIRESAATNTVLVVVKLGVVLFVIGAGVFFVNPSNWTKVPAADRLMAAQAKIPALSHVAAQKQLGENKSREYEARATELAHFATAQAKIDLASTLTDPADQEYLRKKYEHRLPKTPEDQAVVAGIVQEARDTKPSDSEKWGLFGALGVDKMLEGPDKSTRSNFFPYGFSGVMLGAALVFFAYIGFDAVSTHAEEAKNPQRDIPIGILASLAVCTVLYIAVAAVITGMQSYPDIDRSAAVASAFRQRGQEPGNEWLNAAGGLIALGGLAGLTSVILITFQGQSRIFMAMARDGLLPARLFANIHPRFQTPFVSTIVVGVIISLIAGFTPIDKLANMVNIGTLLAFAFVCGAVMLLRMRRPEVNRPFKTPLLFVVAPVGILANVSLMMFLSLETWGRLVIWLALGLVIYFAYGKYHSVLGRQLAAAR